ncbi:MAG: response regulator transcription factor [Lachnobacterium sp.]|nr:response regulator transcription factor [Lachnobacterium sp.]MCI7087981.1 response regulator transcription factor [Lachnobacterium sp.]MCI7532697.1 response regulator transcription factor [Lachnobacterium sp.]MDD7713226.1 response regulator transcription factor [Lachnobacterium sp.]MDY5461281.1 response regulator transcription factor [Agathobacter sp.]
MRILVVEDNLRLADTLADALRAENYMVDIANDGLQGYEDAASGIYDILILDLMLPKMNGYEVLSSLRSDGNHIPVLILSARSELDDKLQGFRVGADDYVTKPFEIEELIMRIQAITRRRISQDIDMQFLRAGDLAFDNNTCEISNINTGKSMKISGKEMQLCEFLLINQNQVLEKEQIATKIWGYDSNAEYNNVEVYISFLRRKFQHLQVNTRIRAVRGVGYILEAAND